MGRAPCCDKANVKKGPWSPEEDAKLKSYIEQHGTGGNWIALPQKIGLKRCGKSCRLRWLNYLRPNIKHGGFSEEEDNIICSLYISIGSRWSIIAAQLPGRTDNDIKNYWNTRLKKKLLGSKHRSKDMQRQNRRAAAAGVLKQQQQQQQQQQETKRDDMNGDLLISSSTTTDHHAYWPEPTMPIYPINQAEHRISDEHSSIRRLLMKLGGRFSTDQTSFAAAAAAPPQQAVYDASENLTASNSLNIGSEGFNTTELEDMFCSNSVKLEGLDCFYGIENMVDIDSNNGMTSTSPDNTNWNEVSPLINYQAMIIPSYQSMQPCMFEEPMHLGTQ